MLIMVGERVIQELDVGSRRGRPVIGFHDDFLVFPSSLCMVGSYDAVPSHLPGYVISADIKSMCEILYFRSTRFCTYMLNQQYWSHHDVYAAVSNESVR